jgi:hypothetical protein
LAGVLTVNASPNPALSKAHRLDGGCGRTQAATVAVMSR